MNVWWFGSLPTTKLALDYWMGTFLGYFSLCLLQLVCCYCNIILWGASITTTDPFILSVLKGIPSGGSVSYEHTVWHSQGFIRYNKHPNVWNKKGWTGYDHDTAQEECLEGTLLHYWAYVFRRPSSWPWHASLTWNPNWYMSLPLRLCHLVAWQPED